MTSLLSYTVLCVLLAAAVCVHAAEPERAAFAPHAANPILPGYYADPSIVQFDGKTYIYATLDPWGGRTLGCWESADWKNWTYRDLNWPTKAACTSPTSKDAMVWAPSVVHGPDGKFHMAVSVGNEVWAGVADAPLGPWKNARPDRRPWIDFNFRPGFHMIDAELFVDTDGTPYLYWGSGFEWINGKCWAVKLKPDCMTFDGDVKDVTPSNYFEAPFMVKHGGRYFLMYSSGKTTERTYQVHYAVGATPLGPFKEGDTSPVLVTDDQTDVISPGHHAVFEKDRQAFILYHRHSVPFEPPFVGRQTCVDALRFTDDGRIEKVKPTHDAPLWAHDRQAARRPLTATYSASSTLDAVHTAARAGDDNYATRWAAGEAKDGAKGDAWLQIDLGTAQAVARQEIRPEYAWQDYRLLVQTSDDGEHWTTVADYTQTPARGSPIVIDAAVTARYLRLTFPAGAGRPAASVWEWFAY